MITTDNCCDQSNVCTSPLIGLYDKVVSLSNVSLDPLPLEDALEQVLTEGLYLSAHGAYCCPDCNPKNGYYFLGSSDKFYQLANLYDQIADPQNSEPAGSKYPCCLNHHLSVAEAITYRELMLGVDPPCCNTSFAEVVNQLHTVTANFGITNFIEANVFNGTSGLQTLLDYIESNGDYDMDSLSLFFQKLFELGLVIKCFDCDIYIGSVDAFEIFGTAYNLF